MVVATRNPDPVVLLFLPLIMFHSLHTLKCLIPFKLKKFVIANMFSL